MKGTAKQIKWAEDIIASVYKAMEVLKDEYKDFQNRASGLENILGYTPADVDIVKAKFDEFFGREDIEASVIINKRQSWNIRTIRETAERVHKAQNK